MPSACAQVVYSGGVFLWVNRGTFPQTQFYNVFYGYKLASFPVLSDLFARGFTHRIFMFLKSCLISFPCYTQALLKKLRSKLKEY